MIRHFTATAFVVKGNATLLHWHQKLQQWMPPGGHIEENETPIEAVLREVREETGLVCDVVTTSPSHQFPGPLQLPAPYTILLEDIPDPAGTHQHIDLIYFVRPIDNADHERVDDPTLRWVTSAELGDDAPLDVVSCGISAAVPEDVRELAQVAIRAAGRLDR